MNSHLSLDIKVAGQAKKGTELRVTDCLTNKANQTPEKLKKFRKTSLM